MTYAHKRYLVLLLTLITWPLALPARWLYRAFGSTAWFEFAATMLSILPGRTGQYVRTSFYVQTLRRCAFDAGVGFLSTVLHPEAELGRRLRVGSLCLLGHVRIGDEVMFASRVVVKPPAQGAGSATPIDIGGGSWIGESAIIQANVGARCIVGAGSVLLQAVPSDSTVAGNPARLLPAH